MHLGEDSVLAKRRCPHTGIVNFYCDPEPFMAVGSIAQSGGSNACVWRSYIGEEAGGLSSDMASAEARLATVVLAAIAKPASSPHRARRPLPAALGYGRRRAWRA
jgi:hypothetical protein